MNYKNRKPKKHKGCCGMCCLRDSDGRRNGRKRKLQEVRALIDAAEQGIDVRKDGMSEYRDIKWGKLR